MKANLAIAHSPYSEYESIHCVFVVRTRHEYNIQLGKPQFVAPMAAPGALPARISLNFYVCAGLLLLLQLPCWSHALLRMLCLVRPFSHRCDALLSSHLHMK